MTDKKESSGDLRLRFTNYARMLVLASGGFLSGFYIGVMNALGVPIIQGVLGYDAIEDSRLFNTIYGMTNFLFSIGGLIGNVVAGVIANSCGRRAAFYFEVILMALAIAPSAIAHTSALLTSRLLIGVSVGINLCIYNIILAEMLPNKLCGIGGGIGVFFLTLGLLISSLCQNIWNYDVLVEYWRWLVIYPMMIELMRVIAFPFLFKSETPPFIFNKIISESKGKKTFKQAPLINKNEFIREYQNQETITIRENVPKPTQGHIEIDQDVHAEAYRQIKRVKGYIYPADRVDFETTDTLSYMEGRAAHGKADVGIRRLFGRRHRRQFLAGCFLGLSHELCGGAFFFVYSTVLFDQISGNGKLITLIIATVNIVVALGSIFSVAYIGRKPNLVIGLLIQGVALLILLIGYKTFNVGTVMVSAILFVLGFCLGIGGAQLIYLGEILPPKGVGIAFGIQSASYAILGLVIPLLVSAIGPMPLIIFFMIFCFSATVICQVYIIETRNKSAKEIFDEFNASITHLCSRSKNLKIEPK